MGIDGKYYKADKEIPESYEGIHGTEFRAVMGRAIIPKDRLNLSNTAPLAIFPDRSRPQTASGNFKFM